MHLEIFLAVIVEKFLAGLDVAERENKNTTLEDIDLAIGRARMVDEAGGIRRYFAVYISLVQKRYFPRFSFICSAVAGRPRYSMTHEPLGMRS